MKQVATGDNLAMISKSVGGNGKAVQSAFGMGLPMIMGSMANNASKPGGTDVLTKMLAQGAASNPMDNLGGFLGNPAAAGGSGMVSTLFGSQMGMIQNAISQKTGLPHGSGQGNGNSDSPGHGLCRQDVCFAENGHKKPHHSSWGSVQDGNAGVTGCIRHGKANDRGPGE